MFIYIYIYMFFFFFLIFFAPKHLFENWGILRGKLARIDLSLPQSSSFDLFSSYVGQLAMTNVNLFHLGQAFLLTGGAFLLTVRLLRLQSLKALIGRTFPL